MRRYLLAAVAVVASSVWATPPWFVRTWQSDAGLPDNTVMGVAQTPDGFLWVATKTGLARFDGVQFRPFTPVIPDGAPSAMIQSLLIDRRGRLWVLDDRGRIVFVEPGQNAATTVEGVPGRAISPLLEAPDGALWFAYEGVAVVRFQEGRTRTFTAADGLPGGGICLLAFDQTGQLWFAQGSWVGVFREERFCPLDKVPTARITGAREGGVWACFNKQLWRCTEGVRPVKIGDLPTSQAASPTLLYEDRTGNVWIGTREAGLFSYDGAVFESVATSQQAILCVQEDREGSLWVGTRGGGLNQLKPRTLELLTTTEVGAPLEALTSIAQDTDGVLWAVVWQKGTILRNAGQGWMPLTVDEKDSRAWTLAADPQGGIWIGQQYRGLCHWQEGAVTARYTSKNGLAGTRVNTLLTTPSGALWMGVEAVGEHNALQCLEQGQFHTFPLPTGSGNVEALAIDTTGDCWAATSQGRLMRVRQNVLTDETATVFPRACVIRCLYVTTDNSLWLGSAGQGLGRLKAGRFTQFSTEQGLPDDYLSNILSDNHGRLWFAGNRGIFSVPQKAFDDIDAGKATRVLPMVYGRNDGLQRLQASHDAWPGALRGADGRLMFAMQSGVAVVYPDEIKEEAVPPSAVIERVTVNGKTVAAYGTVGPRLRLAPGQRQVEFSFTAPSLLMPESMGFKYRLHGLDKTWVNAGARRTADYSQLVPGHYQFQVAACNSNGVWNEDAVALELVVEPYWWETTWFRVAGPLVAASLILAGVILFLRRRYTFKIERLELLRATEKERSRIAADLHDEVGSSLTKISRLAAKRDDAEISETARRVVQAMDEIVWTVNPRNDTLDSLAVYLVHYLEDFLRPAGIACEFNVALKGPEVMLSAEMRHNLFLAVKEVVNNAVKHAEPRRVRLGLALHEEALTVTVQDDGCGFTPGAQAVGADGLVNIRQRLAAIGGQVDITSVPGHGTTVTLQVVLNRKAQT